MILKFFSPEKLLTMKKGNRLHRCTTMEQFIFYLLQDLVLTVMHCVHLF